MADTTWFDLTGDARLGRCATEGCGGQPTLRMEGGGVGANYCSGCAVKMRTMADTVTEKLLPCPLCQAQLERQQGTPLGDIYAHPGNGCAIQVSWFTATPEWIAKWNRRTAPAEPVAWPKDPETDMNDLSLQTLLAQQTSLISALQAKLEKAAEALEWALDELGQTKITICHTNAPIPPSPPYGRRQNEPT